MADSHGFDYIIVGGGSSACVVAARLVTPGARVLLLERGPAKANPIMHIPAGYMKFLAKDTYLAMHQTKPQPQLGGRGPIVPQGKVLGGGSTVNAMVYMRGQAADFDLWNELVTAPGSNNDGSWSYKDLLPYFKAQEDNDHLAGEFHGVGGPLKISHLGHTSPMTRTYVKTLQGMGIPYNPDFNGAEQFGVGFMQHTIDWNTRKRSSAVDAFLAPVMNNPKLTIETGATVTSIRMEGDRVVGVDYVQGGARKNAEAGVEVILAAGAYQTPKLLMISGIGPEEQLKQHGIATKLALPGVGKNLQDHYECPVVATTKGSFGYYKQDSGWPMIKAGLQYLMFKSGPASTTGVETCAFYDPDGNNDRPTIQMFCVPTVYLDRDVMGTDPGDGVTINSLLLRPKARGSVTLSSSDPFANPIVDTQIFGHPDDLKLTMAGFRFARQVLAASPMRDLIDKEIFPGAEVTSDDAIAAHCKRTVKTGYHPVGTCKMGHDGDPDAVLDTKLNVRGTRGLRVIDASLMPAIVSGNTNAAVLAAAGKAADIILS
ncbi:GMC family oxidoreductase N-terminal domain-containing protein [Agrobacterium sp. InxBP2]|uniref:GMC family oxidoreductase n=1 Tax=Agrobacterium sp. InxBP2 TaxID=2870329 RepID=UPI00249F488D|nr:GMC family oxidoreductase N-terminal domain-containing protein [Agrobacterium sp. InxBP2]MCW8279659.1 GMC family oxidoreductase N-terminal domain-containing protein [Agrobacterium sp. InxBP2]